MASFEIWKKVVLNAGRKSSKDYQKEFKEKNVALNPQVLDALKGYKFASFPKTTEVKLTLVPVKALVDGYGMQLLQMGDLIARLPIAWCSFEIAFALRGQYLDQPRDEKIWIGTKPIESVKRKKGYDDIVRRLLFIGNHEHQLSLSIGQGGKFDPSGLLNSDQLLAFVMKEA
ncbi:MAG: hypothetical protein A3F47_00795 [Candidatus Staskawiczbacteria bacterium RIFCSPHIGHO2_12_FULL_38_11]|uniref:Uncharacterized protein n=1 Tax=Candidatus Staskawiczbacteria bacterium RIFCSPHIGHO2_12_FULL_38_11 TaxID=1802209 RepID=A0A1G2I6Z3_9BACT|nr:MAG: hypothetical protein A3F47_00795 [Candidatus Staskawiczbacteria bacterium RIFCSPHIGHO2_12_FULL_38_11]